MFERYDLVIINRSFWPVYPVIGEGLMRLAESVSHSKKVAVILQDHDNIKTHLKQNNRGLGVKFYPAWSFSSSSSIIIKRILDSLFFMIWVIFCLIITRPKTIYVSTDPPILIPFIIAIFSKIIKINFIYHIQDIHPEITNFTIKINSHFYNFLKSLDNFSIRHANLLITLNDEMKAETKKRSNTQKQIIIIENPSVPLNIKENSRKKRGFSFTGNLGRLQRVPLLIESINRYEEYGGKLMFEFAGGGLYSDQLQRLSKNNSLVKYHGFISPDNAINISSKYEWALVSIEDEITRYSFPSKISSYICSDAKILAICGRNTSVGKWVRSNQVGIVISPIVEEMVDIFFKIENQNFIDPTIDLDRTNLKKRFQMDRFVENMKSNIIKINDI